MSVSLTIHPLCDNLPMYGELDPSSAYSLSGHISIAVTSPYSIFEARRAARLLLQSVSLTFEGQSEIFTPTTGYSSLRLCSVTRELAPSTPIELSNEGHEDSDEPCVWNVIFNMPIPGWLPASNSLGAEEIGTRYALYATAKFSSIEEDVNHSTWSFASLCAPFRSRVRTAETSRSITISRFISAPKADITESSLLNYLVNSTATSASDDLLDKERIPVNVLSKIQVLASVPEWVDVQSNQLPLTLRLRTKDLPEDGCNKLQVTEVDVDIIQQEKCRHRPAPSYLSRFPIPPKAMQPPNLQLRDPHPISSIYDVGLYISPEYSHTVYRTFSLLPEEESGKYALASNNYVFVGDASASENGNQTWYTMHTTVPFVQQRNSNTCRKYDAEDIEREGLQWAGPMALKAYTNSPLYSVQHEVAISLTCTYDLQGRGGPVAKERLTFKVPLTFANVAPRLSRSGAQVAPQVDAVEPMPNLPVYSQLYDSNGERRIDYSTPLPLYTPRSSSEGRCDDESIPLIDLSSLPLERSISTTSIISNGADPSTLDSVNGVSSTSQNTNNVDAYHDVNGIDSDVEKRHTSVVVQPNVVDVHRREGSTTGASL